MLYIGAAIENTPFHARQEAAKAAGAAVTFPTVSPDLLADLLWTMHSTASRNEAAYPDHLALS